MSPISHTSCVLSNGLRVVNFSSPHPFTFDTGDILPACHKEWVNKMSLDIEENETVKESLSGVEFTDVKLSISVPKQVREVLYKLMHDDFIDIILVPFMVLSAMKDIPMITDKCRVIRVVDRVTKVIHSNKFCV